jgi:hypothetical protein
LRLKRKIRTAIRIHDNVYETDRISTPFVLGFLRPIIYLPTGLDARARSYVIEHERKHIRRLDYLLKPLAFLTMSVHWFNPLAWISYILAARDMELSADEYVMKRLGADIRGEYAHSLLTLSVRKSWLVSPLAFGETSVNGRVKNALRYKRPALWMSFSAVAVVIAASMLLISSRASDVNTENMSPAAGSEQIAPPSAPSGSPSDAPARDVNTSAQTEVLPEKKTLTLEDVERINRGEIPYGDIIDAYAGEIIPDENEPNTSFWTGVVFDPDNRVGFRLNLLLKSESGRVSVSPIDLTTPDNNPDDPAYGYVSIPCRETLLDQFVSYAKEGKPTGIRSFASPDGKHAVEFYRTRDIGPEGVGIIFVRDGEARYGLHALYSTVLWTPDSHYALVMSLSTKVSFERTNRPELADLIANGDARVMMYALGTAETESPVVPMYQCLLTGDLFARFQQAGAMQGDPYEFSVAISPDIELLGDTNMALTCELWQGDECVATMPFHYDFLANKITEDSIVLQ